MGDFDTVRRMRNKKQSSGGGVILVVVLLLVLVGCGIWYFRNAAPAPSAQVAAENGMVFGGLPRATAAGSQYTLLTNRAYVEGYSEARKDPVFGAYHLTGQPLGKTDKRPAKFSVDERTRDRVTTEDYTRSGFDRGHMVPNHVIDMYFGPEAQLETFLMSNVVPQQHTLNAGVWEKIEALEAEVEEPKFGEMWVFVGPIFDDSPRALPSGVEVPSACFRIWVRRDAGVAHAEAFICPNVVLTGKETPGEYVAMVKEVEGRAHLEFFEGLPAADKARLEGEKTGVWP